jgi:hypothetical protein
MDIVIESGALYLAVQLVFVILFAIRHPAQGIIAVIAVQIYVRNVRLSMTTKLSSAQYPMHTGHRANTYHHSRRSRAVKYAIWKA